MRTYTERLTIRREWPGAVCAPSNYALRGRAVEGCDDPRADWMLDVRLNCLVERSNMVRYIFTHGGAGVYSHRPSLWDSAGNARQ